MSDGSLKFDTKIDTDGVEKGTRTIKSSLTSFVNSIKGLGLSVSNAFNDTSGMDKAGSKIQQLVAEIDQYKDSLYYLEKQGMYFGDKEYDEAYSKLSRLEGELNSYKKSLAGADVGQKKVASSADKASKNIGKVGKSAKGGQMSMFKMLKMSLLFAVAFQAISGAINAVVTGFQNLAQYDSETNKTISTLQTSLLQLKNSLATAFSPILTAITPALQTMINFLSAAITKVGEFFSALLLGKTTFTKAVTAQTDYAASVKKSTKATDKEKGSLAGFDKLNNQSDSGAGKDATPGMPDPSEMFKTENIDTGILKTVKAITDGIKTALSGLNTWATTNFAPIFSKIWTDLQPGIETFKKIVSGMFTDIQTLGKPLMDYFAGPFTELLKTVFTYAGTVVVGLLDTFNLVFSDIWNKVVFPLLQNFITVALPMLTEFLTGFYKILSVVFTDLNKGFQELWKVVIAPVLGFITQAWIDLMNMFAAAWNKWGGPIMAGIQAAWTATAGVFNTLWKTILKPVWTAFMAAVTKLWDEHLKPLLANFLDFVGELVNGALTIYNKFIAPLLTWFLEKFGPPIGKVISGLIKFIGDFLGGILDAVSGIITALKGIVQFITGVFTGDWKKAWTGIQNIFKGIFDALVNIVRAPINLIIDLINGMISGIVDGINTVIKAANKLSFKAPDWLGGKTYGVKLETITAPKIPKLATGTVVPANYGEFLAVLGDNKRETEVVSPISSMKQAFKEAMTEMGGSGSGELTVNVYLSGKQIHTEVVKQDKEYESQYGKSAFAT